jgi:hypothetical protein
MSNPLSLNQRSELAARRLLEAIEDVWILEFEAHYRYDRYWSGRPLEPYWYLSPDDSEEADWDYEEQKAFRAEALDYEISRERDRAAYGTWRL